MVSDCLRNDLISQSHSQEPVTAITWAHADQKLFVATTNLLHSIAIHRGIPSLQSLCQMVAANALPSREASFELVLPTKLKVAVAESFDSVVQVGYHKPFDCNSERLPVCVFAQLTFGECRLKAVVCVIMEM